MPRTIYGGFDCRMSLQEHKSLTSSLMLQKRAPLCK